MSMHYRDMNRDQLIRLVEAMGWSALDLAQQLEFTNQWLKDEYKPEAYENAHQMASALCQMSFEFDPDLPASNVDIAVYGKGGITRITPGNIDDIEY